MFTDPATAKTARLYPDPIATCPDGTSFPDKANADAVAEAFKQWKDLYDATAKVREQAAEDPGGRGVQNRRAKAALQALQKNLKVIGKILSYLPNKKATKKGRGSFACGSKVFDAVVKVIDQMSLPSIPFATNPQTVLAVRPRMPVSWNS